MRGRRRDDVERVSICGGLSDGIENPCAAFGGNFAGGVGIGVVNAGKLDLTGIGQFHVKAGVMLPQRADTQNGHSNFRVGSCHEPSLPLKAEN